MPGSASYQNEMEVACSFGVAAKMGWGKGNSAA